MSEILRRLRIVGLVALMCSMAFVVAATPLRIAAAAASPSVSEAATANLTFSDNSSTSAQVYYAQNTYAGDILNSQTFQNFLSNHGFSESGLTLIPGGYGYGTDNGVVDEVTLSFQTTNTTSILAQYYLNGTVLPIKEPAHGEESYGGTSLSLANWAGYQVHNCNYDLFGYCGVSGSGYGPYDANYISFTNPSSFSNGPSNEQTVSSWQFAIWTGGGNGEATNGTNPTWFLQGGEAFWGNNQATYSPCSTSYDACFFVQDGVTGTPSYFTPSVSPYGTSMTINYEANANCLNGDDMYETYITYSTYTAHQDIGCIPHSQNTYSYMIMEAPTSSHCSHLASLCQIPEFSSVSFTGALTIGSSSKSLDANADYTYQISMEQVTPTTNISTSGLTDNGGSTDSTWTCTWDSISQA
jgi:hypothetical protein